MKSQQLKEKLSELFKDNRIVVGVFVLIIVILVIAILSTGGDDPKEPIPDTGIDQPLEYDSSNRVELDDELLEEIEPTELPVYDLLEVNHSQLVDSFLIRIGKGLLKRENIEDVVYYWRADSSEFENYVEYSRIADKLFFKFTPGADYTGSKSVTTNNAPELFATVVNDIIGVDYEYGSFNVTRVGNNFRVEANRIIGETPLEITGYETYSDYMIFESDGDLLEGQIYLFEYDEENPEIVDLVDPLLLGAAISRSDYPKEFNQVLPEDFNYDDFFDVEYDVEPGSGFLGDAPPQPGDHENDDIIEFPEAQSCTAKSIEVVYFYFSLNYKKLTPVFRIDCEGEIQFEGRTFAVDVVVYASAIDPEIVYIPGE